MYWMYFDWTVVSCSILMSRRSIFIQILCAMIVSSSNCSKKTVYSPPFTCFESKLLLNSVRIYILFRFFPEQLAQVATDFFRLLFFLLFHAVDGFNVMKVVCAVGFFHDVLSLLRELVVDLGPIDGLAVVQLSEGRPDHLDKGPEVSLEFPPFLRQRSQPPPSRWEEPQQVGLELLSIDHASLAGDDGRVREDGKAHEAQRDGPSIKVGEKDHDQAIEEP
mmetsp:Transcript_19910/g.46707  ORF Transcript_19910/g.46707 Transcript_19910/m.46707 type:complete len:220 (+) Transcript_19910:456-1115(+)